MAYPTDLTDEQWELLEPVLGAGGARGPQPRTDRRRLVDAVLYQMVDCQVTKGDRGGPSFHENHGKYRLCGAKKVIAIDYLGLPIGAAVFGARRHDVGAARELLNELLPRHPRVAAVLGDRGFRGLAGPMLRDHDVVVEIKHRDRLPGEFKPIRPLWRVEDCFAEFGRWRRLARSFEATPKSAAAWVQVAAIGWTLSTI